MKTRSSWIQIRKEIYKQVREHVEQRMGRHRAIENYEKDYALEFKKKWQVSNKDEFFQQILKSNIILLADFHALYQSQKSHLRILKSQPVQRSKVLALECFYTEDQKSIDAYLQGKMTEKDFLRKIKWSQKWGFPWSHYRKLIHWAQENKVPVFALNQKNKQSGIKALTDRDKLAAEVIAEIYKKNPQTQIWVIYGDLHLAQNHLPLQIEKKMKTSVKMMKVFQNSEKVYFQLAKRNLETQVDVVRLAEFSYCLNSVPPWVKWQNYLLYLEQNEDADLEDENELDLSDHVVQLVRILNQDFQVQVPLDRLSVFTAQEENLWHQLESQTSKEFLKGYFQLIESQVTFYNPEAQVGFLSRMTVNHSATLAMNYLHAQISGVRKWGFRGPEDLEKLIWVFGFGYFGSKLINPKRKADTMTDIKSQLACKKGSEYGREALRIALAQKMNELMFMAHRKKNKLNMRVHQKSSYFVAAQLLGGLLGERLYNGFHQGLISRLTLLNLLKKDWSQDDFSNTYYEVIDMIEDLPLAFKSKKEKL